MLNVMTMVGSVLCASQITVDDLAAARTLDTVALENAVSINVLFGTVPGDGRGGRFQISAGSPSDNSLTANPGLVETLANGAFTASRQHQGVIEADWSASSDDASKINSAILAASELGASAVHLAPRVYRADASIDMASGIDLVGAGDASVLTKPNGAKHDQILALVDDVRISALALDGRRSFGGGVTGDSISVRGRAVRVDRVSVFDAGPLFVQSESEDVTVTNSRFEKSTRAGIGIGATDIVETGPLRPPARNIRLQNLSFKNMHEAIDINDTADSVIVDTVHVWLAPESDDEAIDIGGGNQANIVISNVIVDLQGASGDGFSVKVNPPGNSVTFGVTFRDCQVVNGNLATSRGYNVSGGDGIRIRGGVLDRLYQGASIRNSATNVTVVDTRMSAIRDRGVVIVGGGEVFRVSNNDIFMESASIGRGIDIRGGVENTQVVGNYVKRGDRGVSIGDVDRLSTDLSVSNNIVEQGGSYNLFVVNGRRLTVSENISKLGVASGYFMRQLEALQFRGNIAFDNGANGDYGFVFDSLDGATVAHNRGYGPRQRGMRFLTTSGATYRRVDLTYNDLEQSFVTSCNGCTPMQLGQDATIVNNRF